MSQEHLPPSAEPNPYAAANDQFEDEERALASGNRRLALILAGVVVLCGLVYVLLGGNKRDSALAGVTPSFLLDDAAVTGAQATETAPAAAKTTADDEAAAAQSGADGENRPAAATAAASAAQRPAGEAIEPLAESTPVALTSAATEEVPAAPEPAAAAPVPTTRTQTGRILDEEGRPLVGATVMLKGSSKGTSTDANGNYTMEVPSGDNTFVVGYGGYEDEVARAREGQPLNVTLVPKEGAKRRRR